MNFDDKNFYLSEAYNFKSKKDDLPIIFFHIPKCGGTTFCNILHNLNTIKKKKSYRISGTTTSFEKSKSAYDNFRNNKKQILCKNYDFIYGHFQYSLKDYFKKYLSITVIRDPIDRCISHYNMMVRRRIIEESFTIEDCFKENLIPKNIITNIFSCKDSKKSKIDNENFEVAINTLMNDIDYVYKTEDINNLIAKIISMFDMPNVLFQKFQTSSKNYLKKNDKNISTIKKYNIYDIEIYKRLNQNNIFETIQNNLVKRKNDMFFILSASIKFNDKFTALMNLEQFKELEKFMLANKFNIVKN